MQQYKFQKISWTKEIRVKKVHIAWVHLHNTLELVKLIHKYRKPIKGMEKFGEWHVQKKEIIIHNSQMVGFMFC